MATSPIPEAPVVPEAALAPPSAGAGAQDRKKRKECEFEGCTIVPVFNFPNESSGRFCKAHR